MASLGCTSSRVQLAFTRRPALKVVVNVFGAERLGRAGVIAFIKPSLSEEVHQLLLSYHHDVVTYLKSKSESPDAEARNRLEAALPRLKALCSGEDSALMTQSDA